MSLITFNVDLKYAGTQLRRIADALEQLIPPLAESVDLKPDEAVSYVNEEKIAEIELAEEAGIIEAYMCEHPELVEQDEPDGGLGVFRQSDR